MLLLWCAKMYNSILWKHIFLKLAKLVLAHGVYKILCANFYANLMTLAIHILIGINLMDKIFIRMCMNIIRFNFVCVRAQYIFGDSLLCKYRRICKCINLYTCLGVFFDLRIFFICKIIPFVRGIKIYTAAIKTLSCLNKWNKLASQMFFQIFTLQ